MISSYYNGSDVLTAHNGSPDYARISPSSISRFFSQTRQWWGENFLDEPGFTGSTATILGTIIHYFAEQAALRKPTSSSNQIVSDYLDTITIEFDRYEIESLWKSMAQTLINEQILPKRHHSVEQFIYHQLLPGIYVAGTYDAIVDEGVLVLRDYKSAAQKPSSFSYDYRMQLHTYAYILRNNGTNINYVELCYITKPTKTLPSRTFTFREPFTQDDYAKIESQLMTIAHSIQLWKSSPDLRWALAQDGRLRLPDKPKLFKD